MSSDRLRRLLDGDIDASELSEDSTLASIADRVFGVKLDPEVKPRKRREMESGVATSEANQITEVAPPTDLFIEVIEAPAVAETPAPLPMPAAELPAVIPAAAPIIPATKEEPEGSKSPLRHITLLLLLLVVANMFGAFAPVFGGMCDPADICPDEGRTKINLLNFYELSSGEAWSVPVTTGTVGIPDIVAVVGLLALTFMFSRKR